MYPGWRLIALIPSQFVSKMRRDLVRYFDAASDDLIWAVKVKNQKFYEEKIILKKKLIFFSAIFERVRVERGNFDGTMFNIFEIFLRAKLTPVTVDRPMISNVLKIWLRFEYYVQFFYRNSTFSMCTG